METPLHKAMMNEVVRGIFVHLLLKNGADVNVTNKRGETALHYAIRFNRTDLVSILLQSGADVNIRNVQGQQTPYELALGEQ